MTDFSWETPLSNDNQMSLEEVYQAIKTRLKAEYLAEFQEMLDANHDHIAVEWQKAVDLRYPPGS